jgi:U3 small nucleolar RNA-associated protein 20
LFFLPLVLQLANDDSKKCKEAVSSAISLLFTRLSTDTVQSFFSYVGRWSQSQGDDGLPMRQAAAQLWGIFVESRPDFIKRGSIASDLITIISDSMQKYVAFSDDNAWELLYYNIMCVEKLNKDFRPAILDHDDIGTSLVKFLAYPHPWVMQASLRIVNNHVSSIDPKSLQKDGAHSYLVKSEGCLYDIARNLCRQLDVDDAHFVEALSVLAIKTVTWLFQAMTHHPRLFYAANITSEEDRTDEQFKNPCKWMMSRLSNIAKPKHGAKRRESIFKCYAALCASCNPEQLTPYLRLMIASLDRAIREETNNLQSEEQQVTHPLIAFPKDVLNLLEDVCGTDNFLEAYTEVSKNVRQKKDQRKQDIASEAVHNPITAAKRKIKKQLHEKERKKRRVNEMKLMRGVTKKSKS